MNDRERPGQELTITGSGHTITVVQQSAGDHATQIGVAGTVPPAPPSPPDTSDWDAALRRYLESVKARYGATRILGQPEPFPLVDIFTDLDIFKKPTAWRRFDINALTTQPSPPPTLERIDGLTLVTQPGNDRLFVLGKPGAGKTTFVKYLALQAAEGTIAKVPIFVSLKEWADSCLDLLSFIVRQFEICGFPAAQPFIEHVLHNGQALVLFDGLDEVTQADRKRLHLPTALTDFSDEYRGSQVLITCRVAAAEYQFERFTCVEVADFDDDQMRTFVGKWFKDRPAKRDEFWTEFAQSEHRRLRELGRTPLFLVLLCLTFDGLGSFPRRGADLYREALDTLLKQWDKSKGIRRDEVYRGLSLGHKHQLLAQIAYATFERGDYILQDTLEKLINAYLCALPDAPAKEDIDAESVLKAIEAQHGILVEVAHRVYTFAHLTFQEYYIACYIVDCAASADAGAIPRLLSYCADDRWREVILLTASLLDNAGDFFAHFLHALDELIADDPTLVSFLTWAAYRAAAVHAPYKLAAIRSYYCWLATLLAYDLAFDLDLARDIGDLAITDDRDLDYAHIYACKLAITLDLDLDRALIRNKDVIDSGPGFNFDFVSSLDGDFDLDGVLARAFARTLALALSCALNIELDLAIAFDLARDLDHARACSRALGADDLHQALAVLALPAAEHDLEEWRAFADTLQAIMVAHRDIGHDWNFTPEQVRRLERYLYAAHLLGECLDLARVTDRPAIESYLLLPPNQTTAPPANTGA